MRERQAAAHPAWIPATVLQREIAAQGYAGGLSQLRAFLRSLKPALPMDPVVRFETAPGEQMQVDWIEFRKGQEPALRLLRDAGLQPHELCRIRHRHESPDTDRVP